MEITIHNTDRLVTIDGLPARIWEGQTASGIPVHCYVTRIAVAVDQDAGEFARELAETRPLSAALDAAIPARLVL